MVYRLTVVSIFSCTCTASSSL